MRLSLDQPGLRIVGGLPAAGAGLLGLLQTLRLGFQRRQPRAQGIELGTFMGLFGTRLLQRQSRLARIDLREQLALANCLALRDRPALDQAALRAGHAQQATWHIDAATRHGHIDTVSSRGSRASSRSRRAIGG